MSLHYHFHTAGGDGYRALGRVGRAFVPVALIAWAWASPCRATQKKHVPAGGPPNVSTAKLPSGTPNAAAVKQDGSQPLGKEKLLESLGFLKGKFPEAEKVYPNSPGKKIILELKKKLDDAGATTVLKEEPLQMVLEEHGFDIVQRAILKTSVDTSGGGALSLKTALLMWEGSQGAFSIFGAGSKEDYVVDHAPVYDPFYLAHNEKGFRFVSKKDVTCTSSQCKERPLDLGDGWALFGTTSGSEEIIAKDGNPNDVISSFYGRLEELTDEWAYARAFVSGKVILPKEKPVATHKSRSFLVLEHDDGKRYLVDKGAMKKRSLPFRGPPVDYRGSVLIDLGKGYQLVSNLSVEDTSSVLLEKPTLEEGRGYVTVLEKNHKRVVLLSSPKTASPEFDEVIEKLNDLWIVARKDVSGGPDRYHVFSPDNPTRFWGPYTVRPESVKGNDGEWVVVKDPTTFPGVSLISK